MDLIFDIKTTKVKQIIDFIEAKVVSGVLKEGDPLPSINTISRNYDVSRDTVFKAFSALKKKGVIDSVHGKNYYVLKQTPRVFILIDDYTPFKEAFYSALVGKIPSNYKVDLWFHQYNEKLYNTIVRETAGKYTKYVVMSLNNEKIPNILSILPQKDVLLVDFGDFDKTGYSYVCQGFGKEFYEALVSIEEQLRKYRKLVFVLSHKHRHPRNSMQFFTRFCSDKEFPFEIRDSIPRQVEQGYCYLIVKETDVLETIKKGKEQGFEIRKDYGVIAYNENPFYELIENGLPCISIDFGKLGRLAADFVLSGEPVARFLPTEVYRKEKI